MTRTPLPGAPSSRATTPRISAAARSWPPDAARRRRLFSRGAWSGIPPMSAVSPAASVTGFPSPSPDSPSGPIAPVSSAPPLRLATTRYDPSRSARRNRPAPSVLANAAYDGPRTVPAPDGYAYTNASRTAFPFEVTVPVTPVPGRGENPPDDISASATSIPPTRPPGVTDTGLPAYSPL